MDFESDDLHLLLDGLFWLERVGHGLIHHDLSTLARYHSALGEVNQCIASQLGARVLYVQHSCKCIPCKQSFCHESKSRCTRIQ